MLRIRPEQVHTLALARLDGPDERSFLRELAHWARSAFWEQALGYSEDETLAQVRAVVVRALSYGLRRTEHVRAFVELELVHGPAFEAKSPYARRTLGDPRLPGGAKLALVRQRLEQR